MENKFNEISKQYEEFEEYCSFVRSNIIGNNDVIQTPFGSKPIVYLDWTASGRSLKFIEDSLKNDVMPYYGNTHSIASNNARQSTWFTHEAREAVRQFIGGNPEDAIIFTGYGSTSGVSKFLRIMDSSNWSSIINKFKESKFFYEKSGKISMNVIQDRWKSYKCINCETQYNTEASFRRHYNVSHRNKNIDNDKSNNEELTQNQKNAYEIKFLVDPSSHHSLFLPFKEYHRKHLGNFITSKDLDYKLYFKFEYLQLNNRGEIDEQYLKSLLNKRDENIMYNSSLMRNFIPIVLISAGSNISGRINNYNEISSIIHEYGGFSLVDFAATAPHFRPNMSPPLNSKGYIDVGVFSPHKFIGGPSTPGVLIIKRDLLLTDKPSDPGGNSVFFVSLNNHEYVLNKEEREESGTIDILGISRLGMLMKFDMKIPQYLKQFKEKMQFEKILREWDVYNQNNSHRGRKIEILGYKELIIERNDRLEYIDSLPIISFLIQPFKNINNELILKFHTKSNNQKFKFTYIDDKDYYLHYNFVCSLMNDLFGIQTRGGCSCAGPYAQRLLKYDPKKIDELYEDIVIRGIESIRPGFSRISIHWSCDDATIDYIIKAVIWIADHGWKLLPLYSFEESQGTWRHRSEWKSLEKIHRKWLNDSIDKFFFSKYDRNFEITPLKNTENKNYDQIFQLANEILISIENLLFNTSNNMDFSYDPILKDIIYQNKQYYNNFINTSDFLKLSDFELLSESKLLWFITPKCIQKAIQSIQNKDHSQNKDRSQNKDHLQNKDHPQIKITKEKVNTSKDDLTKIKLFSKEKNNLEIIRKNKFSDYNLFPKPSDFGNIRKQVGLAIKKFNMIKDGDNILVAVSGGKDSLTMLHMLLFLQKIAPVKFKLSVATVDPQTPEMDVSRLIPYMEMIGIKYHFISYPIVELASKIKLKQKKISFCAFCSRMKRGLLYSCMKENGYNVLALGQHVDDICESFLLSLFHNGKLNTMKANYFVPEYKVRVIRPMIYCREKDLFNFALKTQLPIIIENCPACFSQPKERRHVKQLLSQEESHNSTIYSSIMNALFPLISINHTDKLEYKNIDKNENDFILKIGDDDITSELSLTSCSK